MKKFSNEVCEKIGFYVYRLIDPRNGHTFYVGKGQKNRIFAHINDALASYDGENYLAKDDDPKNDKIKRIRKIHDQGLEVIHIIQKWGLSEKEALLVESVLIDLYENLDNKVSGHDTEYGVCNAKDLQQRLSCEEFKEGADTPPFIIIKVRNQIIEERENGDRYEATRSAWKIAADKADPKKYPYVLSVTDGIVKEVYEVIKWQDAQNRDGRKEFEGKEAPKKIAELFKDKRIPEHYAKKGMASPILFSKKG